MIYLNGINPRTGNYLITPLQSEKLFELISGGDESEQAGLRSYLHSKIAVAGVPAGVNENDPAEAGWGVVFHESESREVINACQLLIEHRKTQIPRNRVKTFTYRGGQTFNKWLAELGVGAGHVDPDKVPLYLLIVGDPEKVPFSFSQRLGLEYRVGRLAFDEPSDYAIYINSLIRFERGQAMRTAGELVVFAPSDDVPSQLSCDQLAEPLARKLGERLPVEPLLRSDATKVHLLERLRTGAPRFFFSASHGLGFALEDDDQGRYQGALVCQRRHQTGPLTCEEYFSATDVTEDLDLTGMTAFFFACFSAATPASDRFFRQKGGPRQLAKKSFFSALPLRLLSNPGGAALAVLGHIDRAWGFSILNEFSDVLRIPFENALLRPLNGTPTGQALRDFYDRFASYSVELTDLIDTRELGGAVDQTELILAWARRNDAAGYILLGDPAAKIMS
jgi:hypothetical protein